MSNTNNKCGRCRFKNDKYENCSNVASEWQDTPINKIPTHVCSHFFSNDDSENLKHNDTDIMTGFMLYDYKAK